jgi:WD40 repeat protein
MAQADRHVPDGTGAVRVAAVSDGRLLTGLRVGVGVRSVAIAGNGRRVALGCANGLVRLRDMDRPSAGAVTHCYPAGVECLAYSPDGGMLATAHGGTIVLRAAKGDEGVTELRRPHRITCVAFAPDGQSLVSGDTAGGVTIWDPATGVGRDLAVGNEWVAGLAFSQERQALITWGALGDVKVWDWPDLRLLYSLPRVTDRVGWVAVSKGDRTLLAASTGGVVKLYDILSGELLGELHGPSPVGPLAFGPDGRTLAGGCLDGQVVFWDVESMRVKAALRGHTGAVQTLAFSPDGRTVASGGADWAVRLWQGSTGAALTVLDAHVDWVRSVQFSPDGRTFATAGDDGLVTLWGG